MDRRVLFASLILFAGGATGVGVALFAFVGVDDATIDAEVVWETEPVAGDDGSGAVVATMDGDPLVLQPTVEDGNRTIRATAAGGDVEWTANVNGVDTAGDGTDPPATSGLVTGDLGGDEAVAFTTESGSLVVLDPADGTERFTVDLGGPGGLRPAIGDLDGDGDAEVAAVTTDGRVRAVDATGDTEFETDLDAPVELRPLAVDFVGDESAGDGDGATDRGLAVATAADGERSISLLDGTGDERWTTTPSVTPLSWSAADTRSSPVLALGGANGNLETIDVADGETRIEVGLQDLPVTVGDADPGRVYVGGSGSVWAVDLLDGEVVWKQQYGGDTRVNAPGVADVDGDGSPGPVVVNRNGRVLALNQQGEVIARGEVGGTAVVYAGPLFADVTGDGSAEVLVVAEDGRIVALSD
ncbi:FG-GAP repeat protein [Halorubrum saccharovorum DSM 1137]|uniref:FG-GAP repeat protein n=1 Tax=Halorubrum saccharovorum DSM 1137 TaxID=1227484 RepID=M0E544_9EURY|nr:PQQ-binding-like beta-propeller repeat protein [Halorubrum saccharovorum]ELZ42910.1 FG-GAP repeat protein [Halorubrum saccharovorum DSM 1137]